MMYILRPMIWALALVGLFALIDSAEAHHDTNHREFAVGVPFEVPAIASFCFKQEAMEDILDTHEKEGYEAGKEKWLQYQFNRLAGTADTHVCELAMVALVVTKVIKEYQLNFDGDVKRTYLVEAISDLGPFPIYLMLTNFTEQTACLNCRPS